LAWSNDEEAATIQREPCSAVRCGPCSGDKKRRFPFSAVSRRRKEFAQPFSIVEPREHSAEGKQEPLWLPDFLAVGRAGNLACNRCTHDTGPCPGVLQMSLHVAGDFAKWERGGQTTVRG